jgi:hypothetical protein
MAGLAAVLARQRCRRATAPPPRRALTAVRGRGSRLRWTLARRRPTRFWEPTAAFDGPPAFGYGTGTTLDRKE